MTIVESPYMRREVIDAVAGLADRDYQDRVWIQHKLPFESYYDDLNLSVHILFDDTEVLPDPAMERSGVLLPGDEIARLRSLGAILDPMIDRLGDIDDEVYVSDPQWTVVAQRAALCLPALVLAGGWESTDTDADDNLKIRAEGRIPTVTHPATRRRVIRAVAALADLEYQQRTWTGGAGDPVTGSLAACLRTLTDDTRVLPDPGAAIGRVLLAGDEIDRLGTLRDALAPFTTVPPSQPWHSPGWTAVVATALHCLPALVIAGAWLGPDPDTAPQTR